MSWIVSGIGKVAAVKAKAKAEFDRLGVELRGAELDLKNQAEAIVMSALDKQPPESGVRVECSGSAASHSIGGRSTHLLRILVEPLGPEFAE